MKILPVLRIAPLALLLLSCGGSNETDTKITPPEKEIKHGGEFTAAIDSYFKKIQTNEIQKFEESQVYWQIFEGLVKYNAKTLEIEPCIASSWDISDDGLVYSFELRDDVYFHDNDCFPEGKGRMVTVEDIVYSMEQVYDPKPTNSAYGFFQNTIVGGEAFRDGKTDSISGIKVDGATVEMTLGAPSGSFLKKLATVYCSVVAREALESPEFTLVGTGPFAYDEEKSNSNEVQLVRNENYYLKDEAGDQLPYLDKVSFVYYENNEDQMESFWNEDLVYVGQVPITKISEVLEERISDFESDPPKYILQSEPELRTTYLEFNMNTPVLKNKKVRQSLNYAVNRKKLVEKIMKNQAYEIGKFGIVPPLPKVFDGFDFEGVEDVGYTYNPQKAKDLLAAAGYPEGKNFPTLEMQFRSGSTEYLVASEIQQQFRSVLNINVDIEAIEFNQLLENNALGKADIFRTNWVGDYATPEAFLLNAYGKIVPKSKTEPSYYNSARYKNKNFDALFEQGVAAYNDEKESNRLFSEAEKILMDDAPFIILWYGEYMLLMQSYVQEFETNSIGYLDFRRTYFKTPQPTEEAASNQ